MNKVVKQTKKNEVGYKRPPNPGPGRPKGTKNKFTNLKQAFLNVFEKLGGEEGLLNWVDSGKRNKELFYHWITKMLPSNVDMAHSGNLTINVISAVPRPKEKKKNAKGKGR